MTYDRSFTNVHIRRMMEPTIAMRDFCLVPQCRHRSDQLFRNTPKEFILATDLPYIPIDLVNISPTGSNLCFLICFQVGLVVDKDERSAKFVKSWRLDLIFLQSLMWMGLQGCREFQSYGAHGLQSQGIQIGVSIITIKS